MRGAVFSDCRTWRYTLYRIWDTGLPQHAFIGLNPSTATELDDDPTIRRCMNFVKSWGGGGLIMLNAFAVRATDPRNMKAHKDPVGPENDEWMLQVSKFVDIGCGSMIAAWGTHCTHLDREAKLKRLFRGKLYHLGLTKNGHPRHPLYLRADLKPELWEYE
jgi:hypothetical protein